MLSVGRELSIAQSGIVCRACVWEGEGFELATGFLRVRPTALYVYAYCCPACGSFKVDRKGKVLQFPRTRPPGTNDALSREAQEKER